MTIEEANRLLDEAIYEYEHFKPYGGADLPCNIKARNVLEKNIKDASKVLFDLAVKELGIR